MQEMKSAAQLGEWAGDMGQSVNQQVEMAHASKMKVISQVEGFGAYPNAKAPEKLDNRPKITQLESEKSVVIASLPDSNDLAFNCVDERPSSMVVMSSNPTMA